MAGVATQVQRKTVSEVRNAAVSFRALLDEDDNRVLTELLTGTPIVTCTGLTLSNKTVNTAALMIAGQPVEIGAAVQFKIVGGTAGSTYSIQVQCDTNATPAQTLRLLCILHVEADT